MIHYEDMERACDTINAVPDEGMSEFVADIGVCQSALFKAAREYAKEVIRGISEEGQSDLDEELQVTFVAGVLIAVVALNTEPPLVI